ncbi:MAG: magnesium transporter [Candidatus Omnitrophica bacterium]|nr:magnesium transporter [Candidatus Omnitrophota bacterium]
MQQFHSVALLIPEIKELLTEKSYVLLKQVLRECNPLDFADSWRQFTEEERIQIFKLLPSTAALKLFEILDINDQRALLAKMSEENVIPLLEGMHSPDLAKIFHKMSPRMVKKMTSLIKRQEALTHIDYLMTFPERSAGSLMHPEFVKLTPKLTARQAIARLSAVARPNEKQHLYHLYVTDDKGVLLGALTLQDLIGAPEDEKLSELMTSVDMIKVHPEADQEELSKLFSKYRLSAVPVVDKEGGLIGVVTTDDIISVVRQEATEDIAKMAGTQAAEVEIGARSIFKVVRLRMPWLLVTLCSGTLISLIIKGFEPVLAKVIALAAFSPLIAGMGGNVGTQSATITVRNLALGRLSRQRKFVTIFREFGVGVTLGGVYGVLLGVISYLFYGSQYGLHFSIVVAVAMMCAMTIAATMGAVGPLLFDRLGIDPATAAGPIVTTTTDIISNFIYFSLATALFLM